MRLSNFRGAIRQNADDADPLRLRDFLVDPGMMPAQVTDSDDSDFHGLGYSTATTAIPAASAARSNFSRSNIRVLRASIASAVAPERFMISMVGTPTTGTSNLK